MLKFAKNYRIPKRPGSEKNPKAYQIFLKSLDDFRRRMRRTKFTKVTPFINYLTSPFRKKDFMDFVDNLEEFRCGAVGMNEDVFYKLVAEFILVPNGIKYYNPMHLFGCAGSFEAEEFRERIFETLVHISSRVGRNGNDDDETYAFINRVNSLHNLVDLNGASPVFRQKDWYCVKSVQKIAEEKGWTIDEVVGKIKIFYRNRIRKVYPEMLLMDFAHGELDSIRFNPAEEKKKPRSKPRHIFAIEQSDWFEDWKNGLKE